MLQSLRGPSGRLVRMASGARIRDFIFFGHRWRDERERVRTHLYICNCRGDFRHMTGDAIATRRPFFVMGMFFDGCCAWSI